MSRLDLVAGPNGAGKTTFVTRILAPALPASVFVNADEIARQHWPGDESRHAYEAAELAADTRDRIVELGLPLIAETVFSHPSKLELATRAAKAGYYVALHVLMVPQELSVLRVRARVAQGGHDVPEEKIRARWHRLWPLVAEAAAAADRATFYDNAGRNGPTQVALLSDGVVVGAPTWPSWAPAALAARWPGQPERA